MKEHVHTIIHHTFELSVGSVDTFQSVQTRTVSVSLVDSNLWTALWNETSSHGEAFQQVFVSWFHSAEVS